MTRGSAADFLIRTVLDEAFRELALADPSRAFEGYDLSEEQQEILRSRDERLLGLLGTAVPHAKASVEHPAKGGATEVAKAPLANLPEVKLLLRLEPHTDQLPDSTSAVAYAASLSSWPGDHELTKTAPESSAPAERRDDGALPELAWVVRILPTVVKAQAAGLQVAYSASIHPLAVGADEKRTSPRGATSAGARSPWTHHTESAAAKAAAQAVQTGDARERYQKLLELIYALQTGDDHG